MDYLHVLDWERAEQTAKEPTKAKVINGIKVIPLATVVADKLMRLSQRRDRYQRLRPSPTTSQPRGEFPRLPPSRRGWPGLTLMLRPFRSVPFSP